MQFDIESSGQVLLSNSFQTKEAPIKIIFFVNLTEKYEP